MLDPDSILKLYANVMHDDIVVNAIPPSEIRAGIQCMANVYMKNADYSTSVLEFPNYNDSACRCAYLHKYAPLHTYIVMKVMMKILQKELALFRELVVNAKCFRFCSLGGGPGSDVIGVLAALNTVFTSFNSHATVIDCMERWSLTFISVLEELKFGCYDAKWQNLTTNFKWNYVGANLLCSMTDEVNKSISSSSFITMVKFVSASTCTNTEEMVDKIFRVMKPGALVLFIDNAAGGFTQIVERAGRRNGLVPKFGPMRHEEYEVEDLKVDRFGYTSCFKTRVTIILLQKTSSYQQSRNNFNSFPNILGHEAPSAKPIDSLDFVVLGNNDPPRGKMLDISNFTRPPQLIKQTSPDPKPQKPPVPSATVEQNRFAVSQSKTNSTPGRSTSNRNDLSLVVDNLKRSLQKPNASAGQMTRNVTTTKPGNRSSYADPSRGDGQNSTRHYSGAKPEQNSPNKSAAPKSPVRSMPTSAYRPQPNFTSSATPRSYRQLPTTPREPARETDDSSEVCCGCCVIS